MKGPLLSLTLLGVAGAGLFACASPATTPTSTEAPVGEEVAAARPEVRYYVIADT